MSDLDFETFLLIRPNNFVISIFQKSNFKKVYEKEITVENNSKKLNIDFLKKFIDDNIIEVEKTLDNFIEKANLIIESDSFFIVNSSIKKNYSGNSVDQIHLNNLLIDLKDQCKNTFEDKKIIHILIKNFRIDKKDYSNFPKDLKCENFAVDVSFICLSNDLINSIKVILNNYQISVDRIVNFNYIKDHFKDNSSLDLYNMTKQIISGINSNEAFLVPKTSKNKGFFEKFFQLFS